jgi:hypothetical protein
MITSQKVKRESRRPSAGRDNDLIPVTRSLLLIFYGDASQHGLLRFDYVRKHVSLDLSCQSTPGRQASKVLAFPEAIGFKLKPSIRFHLQTSDG